jgi:hypothetical protein
MKPKRLLLNMQEVNRIWGWYTKILLMHLTKVVLLIAILLN